MALDSLSRSDGGSDEPRFHSHDDTWITSLWLMLHEFQRLLATTPLYVLARMTSATSPYVRPHHRFDRRSINPEKRLEVAVQTPLVRDRESEVVRLNIDRI
jgi:hypothetical protein